MEAVYNFLQSHPGESISIEFYHNCFHEVDKDSLGIMMRFYRYGCVARRIVHKDVLFDSAKLSTILNAMYTEWESRED